nr:MAG TPA: C2H2 type zinc-finger protein [Caudoviricetes sp.]
MKTINIYQCEHCGFETRDFSEIEKHEAAHFGLTVKDKHFYNALKSFLNYINSIDVNLSNEDKINKSRKETSEKLTKFERSHGLIRGKIKYNQI